MTMAVLHPEELLDKARWGALSTDDRAALSDHIDACTACALHLRIQDDPESHTVPTEADRVIAERLLAATMANIKSQAGQRVPAIVRARNLPRLRWAAIVLLSTTVTGAAAAALWIPAWNFVRQLAAGRAVSKEASLDVARRRNVVRSHATPSQEIPAAPTAAAMDPPVAPAAAPVKTAPAHNPRGRVAALAVPSQEPPATVSAVTPAALFARIAQARRTGRLAEAQAAHGDLAARFAGSREERTALVLVGQVALADATSGAVALSFFDRYLTAQPDGTLGEEARLGRAVALGQLGLVEQQHRAWADFLARYPQSVHAARARAGLASSH